MSSGQDSGIGSVIFPAATLYCTAQSSNLENGTSPVNISHTTTPKLREWESVNMKSAFLSS